MSSQDDQLEALIRDLGLTHCRTPECQTPITPETVVVGWNNRAQWEHPLGGITWLTCTHCGQPIKTRVSPPAVS